SGTIGTTADTGSPYSATVTVSEGTHSTALTLPWVLKRVGVTNPGAQSNVDSGSVSLAIAARDAGGQTLTYSATGLPSGVSINSSTGAISGTLGSTAHTSSPYVVT